MKNSMLFIVLLGILTACSPEPVPIKFGHDACDYCKMIIMDPKFGAELVTTKGKAFKFDDINCLIEFSAEEKLSTENVAHWLVINFNEPEKLINAETAYYTRSASIMSPMASRIASFADAETRKSMSESWTEPEMINWEGVKQVFK
jgi:copper chaperone NosL